MGTEPCQQRSDLVEPFRRGPTHAISDTRSRVRFYVPRRASGRTREGPTRARGEMRTPDQRGQRGSSSETSWPVLPVDRSSLVDTPAVTAGHLPKQVLSLGCSQVLLELTRIVVQKLFPLVAR